MSEYHKHVLPGVRTDFAKLWKGHAKGEYDAWRSRDPRHMRLRIAAMIAAKYNFEQVLDVGCGTGTSTWYLKRANNRVVGIDLDETAIRLAQQTYSDIEFYSFQGTKKVRENYILKTICSDNHDLVCFQGVLAYVPKWSKYLAQVRNYCLVAEYVPPGSAGCVASISALVREFSRGFTVLNRVMIDNDVVVLLGTRK
jgi:2-polyprenyl-3-methyl-5-hydroxy-6-metoxy-1,4-benzoquinol methylase